MRASYPEAELHIITSLCERNKTSIDVGAHNGIYAIHMLDASRDCIAFEPRRAQADEFAEMVRCLSLPVRVEAVALSDVEGEGILRVLEQDKGRSTIEVDNVLTDPDGSERHETIVPLRRLDDYHLCSVGCIKIDVEGHELAVLHGGLQTIRRYRPNILVEVEERHKPNSIQTVRQFFASLQYHGYFLLEHDFIPIEMFEVGKYQDPANIGGWRTNWQRFGVYINNFIFWPEENTPRVETALKNSGMRLRQGPTLM
jgi:FkbM family methyltransferase